MLKKVLGAVWRKTPRSLRRFSAHLFQPHFTVSVGAIVLDERGRIMLLRHVFRSGAGWGIPGGFISKGEQPEAAIRRELKEETGLELERVELAFTRTLEHVKHVEIIFRCRPSQATEAAPQSLEINQVAWYALNQLPAELGRDQRGIIKRALE